MKTLLTLSVAALLTSSLVGCDEIAIDTRSDRQPLYTTGPTYVSPSQTYVSPSPTYSTPAPVYTAPQNVYVDPPRRVVVDQPRRIEQPRYERGGRGDLDFSMAQLQTRINGMQELLRQYGRDNYTRLKDEVRNLNAQVDDFQRLVNRGERYSTLRRAFNDVEQAAAAIDVHIRQMNADRPVNQAWDNVGQAYHRVSEDINFRSASER